MIYGMVRSDQTKRGNPRSGAHSSQQYGMRENKGNVRSIEVSIRSAIGRRGIHGSDTCIHQTCIIFNPCQICKMLEKHSKWIMVLSMM